ncbi:MAG TPA: IS110 family transposase, partial [Acidimicrobiales bacterium]|nr:IS110 family transposase [Acidimicrobiales bacterium]
RWVDPGALARSLPGLADIGGPALAATMGDPSRFRTGKQFRSFTGLVPRADETGDTDRKGQTMSKAGSSLLRTTLVRAADTTRKQDPQLARIYYVSRSGSGTGDSPGLPPRTRGLAAGRATRPQRGALRRARRGLVMVRKPADRCKRRPRRRQGTAAVHAAASRAPHAARDCPDCGP